MYEKLEEERHKSHIIENPPAGFSVDTLRGRQAWSSVFQVLKDYYNQPNLTHPENHHQS